MITFQGNKSTLHSAKKLESNARNIYPHISTSRIRTQIGIGTPDPNFFRQLKKDYSSARQMILESGDIYTTLIYSLKYGGIGNCTEDALLTELIGKINGQSNIYTGSLRLKVDDNPTGQLNHVIAFITDQPIKGGKEKFFKNKDAVIIDPWLGITDFAGNYFTKLRTIFRQIFMHEKNKRFVTFYNDNLETELLKNCSKNIKEYKQNKKQMCHKTSIGIIPFIDPSLSAEKIEIIRETFPELIIERFKRITLCKK